MNDTHPRTRIDAVKQNRILWFSAFTLAFLLGYIHTVTSPDYPLSGTFGIEGRRVSYRFERAANIKDTLEVNIRSDVPALKGFLIRHAPDNSDTIPFRAVNEGKVLRAGIPVPKTPASVSYSARLQYRDSVIRVPADISVITTRCLPRVPGSILGAYFFLLFSGLVLALRCGLEYFFNGALVKKLALFALMSFSVFAMLIAPVKTLFESGLINQRILRPEEMFAFPPLFLMISWIAGCAALFKFPGHKKSIAAVLALLTSALFFFI